MGRTASKAITYSCASSKSFSTLRLIASQITANSAIERTISCTFGGSFTTLATCSVKGRR